MRYLGLGFGYIFNWCYSLCNNYVIAIVIFTLLSKIILLPVSIMVQKNSIKMVKMYPAMNRIKAKCFGNKNMMAEEQLKLYKENNYHPMLDLVPVILQLIILMGVVEAIRLTVPGINGEAPRFPMELVCFNFDFGVIPSKAWGASIAIPIVAALSSWLMCFTQNRSNVLQSEQGKVNQLGTLILSVALSLYLGFFVTAGVGLYWTLSNLMSIVQMYILNACINPKKYIDYEALEDSKKELEKVNQYAAEKNKGRTKEEIALEKADVKRFDKYVNKQVVFYSEKNGFYKYFKDVIEVILKKTNIVIHYITGDMNDEVFKLASDKFRVYYIGETKLIMTMMKMDADVVVLTMPDLQTYHIKRSMVRKDIEYIYMDHAVASANMTLRKHALDHFDTIFATNQLMVDEMREMEQVYDLKKKNVVEYGYSLIDNMIANYEKDHSNDSNDAASLIKEKGGNRPAEILIAPSWQQDNIMEADIDEILDNLLGKGYHVTVRPHPQYVRHFEAKLQALGDKYKSHEDFTLQLDFSSNKTVFDADVLITDWSGIAYEYSFTTLKPTLFINTPMKIMNPDYKDLKTVPFDIEARDQVGISVDTDKLGTLGDMVHRLLTEEVYSKDSLKAVREKYLFNVGNSADVGAKYIIKQLIAASKR